MAIKDRLQIKIVVKLLMLAKETTQNVDFYVR